MVDIVHEAQDTHLCALFIGAHGDTGDYEYALDAANSAAKHLQVIQAELPATSPLDRDAGMLAKFVRAGQGNLSQQRPADNPDELLDLATSLKERLEGADSRGHFSLAKRGFRPNFGSRPRALGHGLRPRLRTSRWPWSGYAASGGALGKASVLVSLRPRVKLGSRKFNCWDSVNSV